MLSGRNFGCGSSREHAPQSLYRAGFRAVTAGGIAFQVEIPDSARNALLQGRWDPLGERLSNVELIRD